MARVIGQTAQGDRLSGSAAVLHGLRPRFLHAWRVDRPLGNDGLSHGSGALRAHSSGQRPTPHFSHDRGDAEEYADFWLVESEDMPRVIGQTTQETQDDR